MNYFFHVPSEGYVCPILSIVLLYLLFTTEDPINNYHLISLLFQISFIEPSCALKDIEIWQQCYFRWIPFLEIQNGGFPHIDLFNRSVQNNIILLQKLLIGGNISSSEEKLLPSKEFALNSKNKIEANDGSGIDESKIQFINSFFPFTSNAMYTDFLDILFTNEDILCDGSIIDSTSLSY